MFGFLLSALSSVLSALPCVCAYMFFLSCVRRFQFFLLRHRRCWTITTCEVRVYGLSSREERAENIKTELGTFRMTDGQTDGSRDGLKGV